MAVDLDKCTGCEACVTACHAENNIPTVVGPIRRPAAAPCTGFASSATGRAISRRAREVPAGAVPAVRQRAVRTGVSDLCQSPHRGRANAQVYNRCIGTRYCANACPYNVRFFNFFNPEWEKPLQLQLNPDVSLREVGVMEKCTFCVQRIKAAKSAAKAEKRELGRRRDAARLRAGLSDDGAGLRRPERSREPRCRGWRDRRAAPSCSRTRRQAKVTYLKRQPWHES